MGAIDQTTSAFRALQRYEQVAARLAADIAAGAYPHGERLPSERDLARSLEVSRASVREAIAALQVQGLVETRPGAGTYVVSGPSAAAVHFGGGADAPHDASPSALLDARLLLEPAVAAAAARVGRRDEEVERLLAGMDRVGDPDDAAARDRWSALDRDFHRRIAELTGNPVLAAFAEQVAALMEQGLWQRLRDDSVATPGRARLHAAEHRLIYEAVAGGDAEAAAFYATQHLNRVRAYMELV